MYGEEDDFEDELDIDEMTYEVRPLNDCANKLPAVCCLVIGIAAAAHVCAGCTSMKDAIGCITVQLPVRFAYPRVGAALC